MKQNTLINERDIESFAKIQALLADRSTSSRISQILVEKETFILSFSSSILCILTYEKHGSSLALFKKATQLLFDSIVKPLTKIAREEVLLEKNQVRLDKIKLLVKWWACYLSILKESFDYRNTRPEWGSDLSIWFPEHEIVLFREGERISNDVDINALNILLRVSLATFPSRLYLSGNSIKEAQKIAIDYMLSIVNRDIMNACQQRENNKFLLNSQLKLKKFLTTLASLDLSSDVWQNALHGRFQKNSKGLEHTVILGENGGFYMLLNTVSQNEKVLLEEAGNISREYSSKWELKDGKFKILIGKGGFGHIRLGMALTGTMAIHPGQIICLKKTKTFSKKSPNCLIRIYCWNDYFSGDVGKYIYSPIIYDMLIVPPLYPVKDLHQKGYTIQQFMPLFDGEKSLSRKKGKLHDDWQHQRAYLVDIFRAMDCLLEQGICMTDVKLANTLYDEENQRAQLIDLSGVVRLSCRADLENCKIGYLKEISYIAPELVGALKKNDDDVCVDLCQALVFSLGQLCLNSGESNPELNKLANLMKDDDPKSRPTLKKSLNTLLQIPETLINPIKPDFKNSLKLLRNQVISNPGKYGLNENITAESYKLFDIKGSDCNQESHSISDFFKLDEDIESFIDFESPKKIYLLLGNTGSGKSTLLQKTYLHYLKNWKEGFAIPIFMNLAVEENLKVRWNWLMKQINCFDLPFSLFSGRMKYAMIIFLDSFDEIPYKKNIISQLSRNLGGNNHKFIISCRSNFIKDGAADINKWFRANENIDFSEQGLVRYIAPLEIDENEIKQLLINNFSGTVHEPKIADFFREIRRRNMISLMKTVYMLHLVLEILPDTLMPEHKSTRKAVYEFYVRKTLRNEGIKKETLLKNFPELKTVDFDDFAKGSGLELARILFLKNSTKVAFQGADDPFLKRHFYDPNVEALENPLLAGVIRGLELSFETRKAPPKEKILIGFTHDLMKCYFLVNAIVSEILEQSFQNYLDGILAQKSILDEDELMKMLGEAVDSNPRFDSKLKELLFGSGKGLSIESESEAKEEILRKTIFDANVLSILVVGNARFYGCDFSGFRLRGANLAGGVFIGCKFSKTDLSFSNLANCRFEYCLFDNASFQNANFGLIQQIKAHSIITTCCFSEDGLYILSGSEDAVVRLWNSETGLLVNEYQGHSSKILKVEFSDDGMLIYSAETNFIFTWNWVSGQMIQKVGIDPFMAERLNLTRSCKLLQNYSNFQESWISAFFLKEYKHYRFNCLVFSSDYRHFVTTHDIKMYLWDSSSSNLSNSYKKVFKGHQKAVNCACFSPNGKEILSGSEDMSVILWSLSSSTIITKFYFHKAPVISVAISRNGLDFLSGCRGGIVYTWDKRDSSVIRILDEMNFSVHSIHFSPNNRCILVGSDFTLKIWNKTAGRIQRSNQKQHKSVTSLAISSDNRMILATFTDFTPRLFDKSTGKLIRTFPVHQSWLSSAIFYPFGGIIASGENSVIKFWDVGTGDLLRSLEYHKAKVNCLAFSKSGEVLASGSDDSTIILWRYSTGKVITRLKGHKGPITSIAFSPGGKILVSASWDLKIHFWNVDSGELFASAEKHTKTPTAVAFSKKSLVAAASFDGTITLWSELGKFLEVIHVPKAVAFSLKFSEDGEALLCGCSDDGVRHIDVKTHKIIGLYRHKEKIFSVVFGCDGEFVSGSSDGSIKLWKRDVIGEDWREEFNNELKGERIEKGQYVNVMSTDKDEEESSVFKNVIMRKPLGLKEMEREYLTKKGVKFIWENNKNSLG